MTQKECIEMWDTFRYNYLKPKIILFVSWIILTVVFMISIIQVFHAYNLFESRVINHYDVYIWLITGGFFLLGVIPIYFYRPFKATYQILFFDIFQHINHHEDLTLSYQVKPKNRKHLHKNSQIFHKDSRAYPLYEVTGTTKNDHTYTMTYTPIIQGAGQYQQTVFKGMFYTMPYESTTSYQIRTKGKPHKKTNLREAYKGDIFTIYTKDGERVTQDMSRMFKKAERLYKQLEAQHMYISVHDDTLTFAYQAKTIPKRQYKRDCEQFEHLYKQFLTMINVVDVLKEEDIFDAYSL
jgi:hypothetical protein